jgi:hypothetical protein
MKGGFMYIKSENVIQINRGNVGWIEREFKFSTGQKARLHTHSHVIRCFNGRNRDITETEIGEKMIKAVNQYLDQEPLLCK